MMIEPDICPDCGHDHETLDCSVCEANGEPVTVCSPARPGVSIAVELGYPDAMFVRLADPEGQILAEITDPAKTRLDVAKTYGIILHSGDIGNVEWPRINAAITGRWSRSSLTWVKRFAWKMGVPEAGQHDLSLFEQLAAEGRCYKPGQEALF